MTYGCPICEFSDGDRDAVFDHIFSEHGEEVTVDARPIELGEFDDEAGVVYEKLLKTEEIKKTELKITPKSESASIKKIQDAIKQMQMQITELQKENQYLRQSIGDADFLNAQTRQTVSKLEMYLTLKSENKRRDFGLLAVDLKKEVIHRGRRGMNYSDIMSFFRFKSPQEAYRLMDVTRKTFSDEIRLYKAKTKKQSNKLVPFLSE